MEDESVGALIFVIVAATVYFLPAFVAGGRKHPSALAIFMLSLFLDGPF